MKKRIFYQGIIQNMQDILRSEIKTERKGY